jgi:hypothetical protein
MTHILTVGRNAPSAKLALGASLEVAPGRFDANEMPEGQERITRAMCGRS